MELKKYKLGDIAEILISSIDKKSKEGESPVRLCNFVDVYHNWAITADMVSNFMEATTSEKNIDRFSLKKGYVAFTKDSETRDDIGVPTYIAEDLDNTVLGYHCALVKPDENIILGKYLNAFLHSDYIKRYFELNATGSGMRYTLSVDTLYNIPILAPSLDIQKRIGELFSNIDRKICINRSLNHYLEAMAKQLYDYWFVQFDFPDANGKPYKSSGGNMIWNEKLKREIPEGWSSEIFSELCDINKLTLSKRDNIPTIEYLDTSSITEGIVSETQYLDRHSAPSRAQRKVEDLTIVYSCVRPRLLHYGILCNPPTNFIVSTGFATIDAKDKAYSILLYYFLISCETTEHLGDIADTAVSSYPDINPSDIGSLRTIVPPRSLSLSFQEKVEVMIREAKRLHLENKELEKKRDYLLPLVMTGQVSVKQLNNDLPLTFIIIRKTSQI